MLLRVEEFELLDVYKLKIRFNNGEVAEVDLEHELDGEIFAPLQKLSYFKRAFLNKDTNTIEWPNGADFAPEFLYEKGRVLIEK